MRLKDSTVRLEKLHPLLSYYLIKIDEVYKMFGVEFVITSGHEETANHSAGSKHYCQNNPFGYGCAIDSRSFTIPRKTVDLFVEELEHRLGRRIVVSYEKTDKQAGSNWTGEHFHIYLRDEFSNDIDTLKDMDRTYKDRMVSDFVLKELEPIQLKKIRAGWWTRNKTNMGMVLSVVAAISGVEWLQSTGALLGSIGLGHKLVKSKQDSGFTFKEFLLAIFRYLTIFTGEEK